MAGPKRGNSTNTLSRRTIIAIILSCLLLSVITTVITVYNYTADLLDERIKAACSITYHARSSVVNDTDSVEFAKKVMERYYKLPPEVRKMTGTREYRDYFKEIMEEYPEVVSRLGLMLSVFMNSEDLGDVYAAMYDRDNSALVYIYDPDDDNVFFTGEWEVVEKEEVEKFLNWEKYPDEPLYDVSKTTDYGWLCTAGVPVTDENGDTVFFVLADFKLKSIADNVVNFMVSLVGFFLLATALIVWVLYRHMRRNVIDPINRIADAANAYAQDKLNGKKETDRFSSLDIHQSKELENLSLTMRNMEQSLKDYEENLTKATAEKQRIGTELDMAHQIQASMLPSVFPAFPDRTNFDIHAYMHPAREVGGDFYDFFLVDNDHLALVIADVSGKGVPAALFMMGTMAVEESCAMLGRTPADILAKTNTGLCTNNKTDLFVTMWVAIVELSTGKVTASNAGHEYPVLYRKGKSFELIKDKHSLFVGGLPGVEYSEYSFTMKKGDKLFVYTDGIPEATNKKKEFFGMDRLLATLNKAPSADPRETIENMKNGLKRFVGTAEQFDDITMMCFEYKG